MRRLKQEAGMITLLESMIVLSIIAILLLLPQVSTDTLTQSVKNDLFMEQLTTQLTLIQNHAIYSGRATRVSTHPEGGHITFKVVDDQASPLNTTLDVPAHMSLTGSSTTYHFLPDTGNINNFKRIQFRDGDMFYEVVFQIGSGRFYVKEVN